MQTDLLLAVRPAETHTLDPIGLAAVFPNSDMLTDLTVHGALACKALSVPQSQRQNRFEDESKPRQRLSSR